MCVRTNRRPRPHHHHHLLHLRLFQPRTRSWDFCCSLSLLLPPDLTHILLWTESDSALISDPWVLPLAESFLVLMILAAYSWPVQSLTQRRTTEKAPLGNKKDRSLVSTTVTSSTHWFSARTGPQAATQLVSCQSELITVTTLSFWAASLFTFYDPWSWYAVRLEPEPVGDWVSRLDRVLPLVKSRSPKHWELIENPKQCPPVLMWFWVTPGSELCLVPTWFWDMSGSESVELEASVVLSTDVWTCIHVLPAGQESDPCGHTAHGANRTTTHAGSAHSWTESKQQQQLLWVSGATFAQQTNRDKQK